MTQFGKDNGCVAGGKVSSSSWAPSSGSPPQSPPVFRGSPAFQTSRVRTVLFSGARVSRGGRRPRKAASEGVCHLPVVSCLPRAFVPRVLLAGAQSRGHILRSRNAAWRRTCTLRLGKQLPEDLLRSPASASSRQQGGRVSASSPPAPAAHGASLVSGNGGSCPVPLWLVLRVAEVFPAVSVF